MKTIQEIMDEQNSLIRHKSERAINATLRYAEYEDDAEWKLEVSKKISEATIGKSKSAESRKKMSESAKKRDNNQLGLKRDQSTKDKISAKKMERTPEERQAQARLGGLTHKGKPKPKYECPHCKKMIAVNMFDRYHNNNCKFKDF